ncbi:MAG: ABC transporter ATP-binding protein [Flavobacteriaceae bacterium]
MKNSILHIKNSSIGYKSRKKIDVIATDISVLIDAPKLICLLGRNGIGKSTLLRTLSRVQPTLEGEIILNSKKIEDYSSSDLSKKISIVLTERIPSSNLSVYELIALGRQVYTNWIGTLTPADKEKIKEAIENVGIRELQNQKVDELSDGQYQKVMIARALAQDTSIILLDEPTAHLDIQNKAILFQLLKKLANEKIIIVSTHELQMAIQNADDLWLMSKGKFICGAKDELINTTALNSLFDSNTLSFDKQTKQFIFH